MLSSRLLAVSALAIAFVSSNALAGGDRDLSEGAAMFAAKAFVDAYSFLPDDVDGQLGERATLFDDVQSYQTYRQSLKDSQILDVISKDVAAVSNEVIDDAPAVEKAGDGWSAKFKARQTLSGRNGVTDRCLDVVAHVLQRDVPDGYAFHDVVATSLPASDCGIVDASPVDKEIAKIEFKTIAASIEGFLQSSSSSLFKLGFSENDDAGRGGIRAFRSEEAYKAFGKAVDDSGIRPFLKTNLMISSSEYAGNPAFSKDAKDDGLWHVTFNVRQNFYQPAMSVSRCLEVAADVRDLPPQFGGAEHAFEAVTFKPAEDQTACETGKELAAAMRDLIRSGKDDQSDPD